jgi:hypothetical protein
MGNPQDLIETLIYECQRVFKDRLVDKESKKRFDNILGGLLKRELKYQGFLKDTYFISKIAATASSPLVKGLPPLCRIPQQDLITMID